MENAKLPIEKAHEPTEEAYQPTCSGGSTMTSQEEANKPKKRHATFADNTMTESEVSQNSSVYKEALSQPAPGLSHRQRLAWLQKRRGPGLWVQCDACNAWRHLAHVVDSHQLPPKWYCSMNPDKSQADCSTPETPLRISDEEDLIHSEYSAGSLVWARLPGWPWWPAMVDDDPDTEQFYWLDGFSDIPTHYNVVFFDEKGATRAWISPENLKPYTSNYKKIRRQSKQYKKRLERSIRDADKAEKLPVVDRLAKFSFINTYKGPIVSPKKVNKTELEMFQKKLKRKFNVDFPIEVSSDSEDEDEESIQSLRERNKKKNVILIGTPKSKKAKQDDASNRDNDIVLNSVPQKQNNGNIEEHNINKEHCTQFPPAEVNGEETRKKKNEVKNPKKISDVVKNTINISFSSAATNEEAFKIPDSLATEIGSTPTLNLGSQLNGFDNDSSKTYVPEDASDVIITQDFQIRAETPSSDDFDF